jgi:glycogen debranching enzyme
MYSKDPDRERASSMLRALWPAMVAWLEWIERARRGPHGAAVIVHPWESGMDNSPSWDEPLQAVAPAGPERINRRDVRTVAAAQRPSEDEYRRYLGIVEALRAAEWDSETQAAASPFVVEDPAFTAIAARAATDLAAAGQDAGLDASAVAGAADRWAGGLESLWDDGLEWYRPFDVHAGKAVGPRTSVGAVALWAPIDRDRARSVAGQIEKWRDRLPWSVPTTDPTDKSFDPVRYWRGPVWVLVNWLIASGLHDSGSGALGETLRRETLQLVGRSFSEYYDPTSGAGIGGEGFSWSAALTLAWLAGCPLPS